MDQSSAWAWLERLKEDLRWYAKDRGISLEQAVRETVFDPPNAL